MKFPPLSLGRRRRAARCGPVVALLLAVGVAAANAAETAAKKDIVDTAVAAEGFETLVTAVKAAELVETLKGEGPFTVFAPTTDVCPSVSDWARLSMFGTIVARTLPPDCEKLDRPLCRVAI